MEARARALGLDAFGVTAPERLPPDLAEKLRAHLAAGEHAGMGWMAERVDERAEPRALWPAVASILVVGLTTAPEAPLESDPGKGALAAYARRRDYHDVIKGRLKELAGLLVSLGGGDAKVFVDTAPVMEKALAAAANLGWQGKHTVLVSRAHGGWLLLGAIYTTLELPPDEPHADRCGSCRACLAACPTDAFPAPYRLDARRCIAYLTIEHHGPIPRELRAGIGNRVFGCDDCLAACPWNSFAQASRDARLALRPELAAMPLADLARLDDAAFRTLFAGTPVKRTGRDRFLRNVLVAIGNSGDPALAAAAERLLDDPAPVVRGAAAWAFARLAPGAAAALAPARLASESDAEVREEWAAVLAREA